MHPLFHSPFQLGLGSFNLRFVVRLFESGLGSNNARFVAWPLELELGIPIYSFLRGPWSWG